MAAQIPWWRGPDFPRPLKPNAQRMLLLKRAAERTLMIHCENGIALKDRDLQWLIRRCYVETQRVAYADGWVRDVRHPYKLKRTYALATDKGRAAIAKGSF